jgi:hypothetical protein
MSPSGFNCLNLDVFFVFPERSPEQKKRTIDVLERVDDALARTWRVFDEDTDELLETYGSSTEVVKDAWKVST